MSADIYLGALRARVHVPGARSLKDRRQAVHSIRDRVRSRFAVSVALLEGPGPRDHQDLVMSTAGGDSATVRQVMSGLRDYLERDPRAFVSVVDLEAFPWHPHQAPWDLDDGTEDPFDG
jgi:uncharacterized protein YlxP (DUF503 family)